MRKELWIDFETGGVNPMFHSPLSCAMLAVENFRVVDEWYGQIRQPPFNVTEEAMQINKLNLDHAGVTFDQFHNIYFKFINKNFYGGTNWEASGKKFLRPNIKPSKENMPFFCGHNTHFDRQVLQQILGGTPDNNVYDGVYYHRIDTMIAANNLMRLGILPRTENLKLETLCKYLGVVADGELHNALTDIKVTQQCDLRMSNIMKEAFHELIKVRARENIFQPFDLSGERYGNINFGQGQDLQSSP